MKWTNSQLAALRRYLADDLDDPIFWAVVVGGIFALAAAGCALFLAIEWWSAPGWECVWRDGDCVPWPKR